jgi:hypothetical protein
MRTLLRVLLSLAAGTVAALAVLTSGDGEPLDLREAEPRDRVLEAMEGLRDDHVHVTADGRAMLDEEGEARVAAALAERDLPVHVVVWQDTWFAGYDHYIEAAEQIVAELDEPSLLVLWQGPDTSHAEESEGWKTVSYLDEERTYVEVEPEYLGDASKRLLEWIEQLPDEPLVRREQD